MSFKLKIKQQFSKTWAKLWAKKCNSPHTMTFKAQLQSCKAKNEKRKIQFRANFNQVNHSVGKYQKIVACTWLFEEEENLSIKASRLPSL